MSYFTQRVLQLALGFCFILISGLPAQAKTLKVIATIKPVHSLVASVMGNKGNLELLVDNGLDPHIFRLKPSDIRQIHNSDVIFYIDPKMETFLKRVFTSKYSNYMAIPLAQQNRINLVPFRSSKVWYLDEDTDHDHANNSDHDLHIWLDPANARRMVQVIEEVLSSQDPDNSLTYLQNAEKTITRLYALEEEIREQLRPLRQKPMIVYHDAFQYYEKSFGLKSVGAILMKADQTPSVKHIKALKKLAEKNQVTCVLGTPGAHPRIATVVMSGTDAGFGIVDPLGLYLEKGPTLYFDMMREMSKAIVDCQEKFDMFEDFPEIKK